MKKLLLISIYIIWFVTCSNQKIKNFNSENNSLVEAIIFKHIGMSDKLIDPILLAPQNFDKSIIEEEIKVYKKYLPKYHHIECTKKLMTSLFESKKKMIIASSSEEQSIYYGTIEIKALYPNKKKVFYINEKTDSEDIIFSFLDDLAKAKDSKSELNELEVFYCNLIGKGFPCTMQENTEQERN